MIAPVEVTTRYVTSVPDLSEAWAFVMSKIDAVGPEPSVSITPRWTYALGDMGDENAPSTPLFEVVVSGMVEEGRSKPPENSDGNGQP